MALRAALHRLALTSARAQAQVRLTAVALISAAACGGSAFSFDGAGGAGNGGRAAAGSSGAAVSDAGGSGAAGAATSDGGAGPSDGGDVSYQGGNAPGGQGSGAEAGSGAALALGCSEIRGVTYGEHCYVDVTTRSVNQVDAAAACAKLGSRAGRTAHLLVLGTEDEESFVIETFLSELTDAWLGLTCNSAAHPELADCSCRECEDGLLLEKRAAWSWPDGSSADFGWSGNNPDEGLRCAALAYNPVVMSWGWVDRSCLSTSHQLKDSEKHTYQVICELP